MPPGRRRWTGSWAWRRPTRARGSRPAGVDGLTERLRGEPEPARRTEYADILARVYKRRGPQPYWGYRPAPRPANTVAWESTPAIEEALNRVLADPERDVRSAAL